MAGGERGHGQVAPGSQIHPELRTGGEDAGEATCGVRRYRLAPTDETLDARAVRQSHRRRQGAGSKAISWQIVFPQMQAKQMRNWSLTLIDDCPAWSPPGR